MLFGKKKKKLFGARISRACSLCRYQEEERCTLGLSGEAERCKKYEYDPLRREPKKAPPLRGGYSEEDFKL